MFLYLITHYRIDLVLFIAAMAFSVVLSRHWSRKQSVPVWPLWKTWLWVGLTAAGGVVLAVFAGRQAKESIRQQVQYSIADYSLDLRHLGHDQLGLETLVTDPLYREIASAEDGWISLNEDLQELFTCRRLPDGRWVMLVHTARSDFFSEKHRPVGFEVHAVDVEALEWAKRGKSVCALTPERYRNRWVTRAFEPVRDGDGQVEAVLVASYFVDDWVCAVLGTRAEVLGLVFLAFAIGLGVIHIARQRSILSERALAEEKLRQSENRFRLLLENLPNIAVQGYDRNRRVIFWNDASAALYGYSRNEAIGRQLEDLIIPDAMRSGVIEAVKSWVQGGPAIPASELVLKRKDGGPVSVFSSHVMQRRWDGEPEMYCIDIALAERDRALAALADSESNYRLLFEMVPHPVIVYDVENLRIQMANGAALDHYGYRLDEFLKFKISHTLPDDEMPAFEKHIQGAPEVGRYGPAEWRSLRKNGAMSMIESLSQAMVWNGRKVRLVVVQDITQRKESERRIREQAELLNKSTEAIVAVDASRRITFWNEGATRLYGLRAEDMCGRLVTEPVPASKGSPWTDVVGYFGSASDEWHGEIETMGPAGQMLFIETDIAVIRDAKGDPLTQLSVSTDISRRKALEAQVVQAQKMEVLGRLAGGVAHDFNSFLMAMSLQLEMLAMDLKDNSKATSTILEVQGMTSRASKLVGQLLLFARRHVMELEPLELNTALAGVTKMLQRLLGADITLKLKGGGEIWVKADALMLDQVVMNLCVNARDAMPQGGHLTIEAKRVEFQSEAPFSEQERRRGQFACLSVRDTGCGMTPEVKRHLFEPFFTTKEAGKGTGLGLSTVHGIVHQHEGWITVDSKEGEGSVFRVFFPICPKPERADAEACEVAMCGGDETILLVDDDEYVRRTCAALLLKIGYRVLPCSDGKSALHTWNQNKGGIDLLLADFVLTGGMTGEQVADELKQKQPSLCVVLMSGFSDAIMNADLLQAKGYEFVAKPMQTAQLAEAIRKVLDRE